MNTPSKVTITITADGYQTILTDSDGNKIFDCKWLEDMGYDDLQSAIDELSSGPFLVASSLYDLKGE